jgi:hypothetical protein
MVQTGQWLVEGAFIRKAGAVVVRPTVIVEDQEPSLSGTKLSLLPANADVVVAEWTDDRGHKQTDRIQVQPGRHFSFDAVASRVSLQPIDTKNGLGEGERIEVCPRIYLDARVRQDGLKRILCARAIPLASLRYTTDGTDPKRGRTIGSGEEVELPLDSSIVLVFADGPDGGLQKRIELPGADQKAHIEGPVCYRNRTADGRRATFALLDCAEKFSGVLVDVVVGGASKDTNFNLKIGALSNTPSSYFSVSGVREILMSLDALVANDGAEAADELHLSTGVAFGSFEQLKAFSREIGMKWDNDQELIVPLKESPRAVR